MDLSFYIEELLYTNDCVIIPTIGGFITNYAPASINFIDQQVLPPQKVVSFNAKLVNNDGLLANYIAQKEHLTYKQATSKLEAFSRQIEADLFNNKIVHFEHIGKLYFNSDSKLEFVPTETNFLKDAYGLPSLPCVPILRNKDYLKENAKTNAVVIQKNNKHIGIFSLIKPKVAAVAVLLCFALASPYLYSILFSSNSDQGNLAQQSAETTLEHKVSEPTSKASLIPSLTVTETVQDSAVETEEPIVEEPAIEVDPNTQDYIIVLGAFGKKRNADRLAKKLEKDNYLPDVTVKNGLNRVGVQITCTPEEMQQHLQFLQENYNKKAWVVE